MPLHWDRMRHKVMLNVGTTSCTLRLSTKKLSIPSVGATALLYVSERVQPQVSCCPGPGAPKFSFPQLHLCPWQLSSNLPKDRDATQKWLAYPRQGRWKMFFSLRLISDDAVICFFFYNYVLLEDVFYVTHLANIVYEIKLISTIRLQLWNQ